jgi:hypothetical protein
MWTETVGDWLVGPHVLPRRLTGNHYRDVLLYYLPNLLEIVSLAFWARMPTCMMLLWYILGVLCEIFSITPIMANGWVEEGPLHGLHAREIWILWMFACGTPKSRCVCNSCWQRRSASPSHCGYLSDCWHLPQYLWTNVAAREEKCLDMRWNTCRIF